MSKKLSGCPTYAFADDASESEEIQEKAVNFPWGSRGVFSGGKATGTSLE